MLPTGRSGLRVIELEPETALLAPAYSGEEPVVLVKERIAYHATFAAASLAFTDALLLLSLTLNAS